MSNVFISNILANSIKAYDLLLRSKINKVIESSTYSELSNYLELLPKNYSGEDDLFFWGRSFINEYFKAMRIIENNEGDEIEELKRNLYTLYLKEVYGNTILSYNEFITFSKLINVTFSDYNPNLIRERDNNPYQDSTPENNKMVNEIIHDVLHSEHPNSYEITKFNLDVLIECLSNKRASILNGELKKIDLDDYTLNKLLSKDRINKLKKYLND